MVLGKLPVPGRPTIWITVGQGPTALAVGAGGGCLDIFTLIYPFSLWETARYRLKYCLKGPLNPKQPTNQSEKRGCPNIYGVRIFRVNTVISRMRLLKKEQVYHCLFVCFFLFFFVGGGTIFPGAGLLNAIISIHMYIVRSSICHPSK